MISSPFRLFTRILNLSEWVSMLSSTVLFGQNQAYQSNNSVMYMTNLKEQASLQPKFQILSNEIVITQMRIVINYSV